MTKRNQYENYLNGLFTSEECLEKTEHCWAGNDKTIKEKQSALNYAQNGLYGTVLRLYDQIAFTVGFNEWKGNQNI